MNNGYLKKGRIVVELIDDVEDGEMFVLSFEPNPLYALLRREELKMFAKTLLEQLEKDEQKDYLK